MFSTLRLTARRLPVQRYVVALLLLAVFATACGSTSDADITSDATSSAPVDQQAQPEEQVEVEPQAGPEPEAEPAEQAAPVTILNHGGSALEGHTPRGFQGMGTGLFAGDELNSNFPADDGVQIWLTFELPAGQAAVEEAVLVSNGLTVRGNPFETLGQLQAAPVRFDAFGPSVVPLEPVGDSVTCPNPVGSTFTCDVSAAVAAEIDAGRDRVQLRLRFEGTSDPDGEQDLALFFLTDSNTNEPGIFRLELG